MNFAQQFFTKRLKHLIEKLQSYIFERMKDLIVDNMEKIPSDFYGIMKEIIEEGEKSSVINKRVNCSFFSCNKASKKKKLTLKKQNDYNIKNSTIELRNVLIDVVKHIAYLISSEEILIEEFRLNDFFEFLKKLDVEKLNVLYDKFNINSTLKNEVDKFSEYFNISSIINMQNSKIKQYRLKIDNIEEARTVNDCIICMENRRNLLFYPCLHFICCNFCGNADSITNCPDCQGKIVTKQLVIS